LQALPPHRFMQQAKGDGFVYVYPDPLVCNCLWVGDQTAYGRYQRDVLNQHIAKEYRTSMEEAAEQWDWEGWGYP
jgi:hypothetical protein